MNTVIKSKSKVNYINLWRNGKDSNGNNFPKPTENKKKWVNQSLFEDNLNILEKMSRRKKYSKPKHCKICSEKNITTGIYSFKNLAWENGLSHYIKKHNTNVPKEFKKYVNNMQDLSLFRFKNHGIKKFKLKRNQLNIMDALLYSGGSKKLYESKKKFYYSEHFGLLDFNKKGLETILVDANTNRVDEGDDTILMPTTERKDLEDYEYIFHTHPPEKSKPGGRVEDGILYEFPSMSDIFHFIYYHNNGKINGSIVNTAEGLYIIKINKMNSNSRNKKLDLSDKNEDRLNNLFSKIQEQAIKKYGTNFTNEYFYSVIAQNKSYIKLVNEVLKRDNLVINYYPRVQNKKKEWVLPEVEIKVNVIEIY